MEHLLLKKKTAILQRWFQFIMDTYPADTSRFLRREKDRFINPVGYTISGEIKAIYDELISEMDSDRLTATLDNIIRIRAVQDFPPSQAIAFIFELKKAIRDELAGDIDGQTFDDLLKIYSRIDALALQALDIYMKWRDKVHQIAMNEVRAEREMALRILEKANARGSRTEENGHCEEGEE